MRVTAMRHMFVYEVFDSVQGEGFWTGQPAVFVRFSGCSVCCEFCDTPHAQKQLPEHMMSVSDLIRQIHGCNFDFVVLTGGEPMEQDYGALCELIDMLKRAGKFVTMETNGMHVVRKKEMRLDWVTVSPKSNRCCCGFGDRVTQLDELKLLYDGNQDLDAYEKMSFTHLYLQPILPKESLLPGAIAITQEHWEIMEKYYYAFRSVLFAILKHPKWRVSFQAHKLIGWR